jgi:hypothetical protein
MHKGLRSLTLIPFDIYFIAINVPPNEFTD